MQADRVDKSAVGFDYQGRTEKHESQRGVCARPGASSVPRPWELPSRPWQGAGQRSGFTAFHSGLVHV